MEAQVRSPIPLWSRTVRSRVGIALLAIPKELVKRVGADVIVLCVQPLSAQLNASVRVRPFSPLCTFTDYMRLNQPQVYSNRPTTLFISLRITFVTISLEVFWISRRGCRLFISTKPTPRCLFDRPLHGTVDRRKPSTFTASAEDYYPALLRSIY